MNEFKAKRRQFIKMAPALAGLSFAESKPVKTSAPIIISTWDFGMAANKEAVDVLAQKKTSLDAAEAGVMIAENDASNLSVGYGGLPDRDGRVTLDACIMNHEGKAGSVCALEHIRHPISVARRVMERTPHVILVGEGALQFALNEGFKKENLLTEQSRKAWEEWKITSNYQPRINIENHDTIGMIVMDQEGQLAGACTTSGLAFKMHGRVGDSPIIGSGLYVDQKVGAATGTGLGEVVLRQCSSFLIVELMRNGKTPQKACEEAIRRIVSSNKNYKEFQVGLLAVNLKGQVGAYAIQPGFTYALYKSGKHLVLPANSYIK